MSGRASFPSISGSEMATGCHGIWDLIYTGSCWPGKELQTLEFRAMLCENFHVLFRPILKAPAYDMRPLAYTAHSPRSTS